MAQISGIELGKLSLDEILTKRKSLRRKLLAQEQLIPVRIAVLGGSTTNELVDLLELQLLDSGIKPDFYQSEYGRYVEAVHDSDAIAAFKPDIVYVHTSVADIQSFPPLQATDAELQERVQAELRRFEEIWSSLDEKHPG